MDSEALEAAVELATVVLVGRLCLSLLPPGWPGYHDAREGGATLGASLLLGAIGCFLLPCWWLWGIALVLRVALLPGAMRPRPELASPRMCPVEGLAIPLALAALAWAAWISPWSPAPVTDFDPRVGGAVGPSTWVLRSPLVPPALLLGSLLSLHALLVRRRWESATRSVATLLLASLAGLALSRVPDWALGPPLLGVMWILAGLGTWRRTADRRARALAVLGLAGALLLFPWRGLG